jgi:hypothetical protein
MGRDGQGAEFVDQVARYAKNWRGTSALGSKVDALQQPFSVRTLKPDKSAQLFHRFGGSLGFLGG